ncbi:MAG TPA: DUF1223 domain-containing protein [Candidatus Eisenbacteria bacterium]|nr:DUF1223 domain-containing protein [Candidatus Eisenbacteria bacterium]
MRTNRAPWIVTTAAGLCLWAVPAFAAEFKSGEKQNLFVELYTSEAVKAAPAAAKWISAFRDSPELWTRIVPAAFHVDYGDRPGRWKDRFAGKARTERLVAYAAKWGLLSPYVPTAVQNGEEWSGWARGQELPAQPETPAGVLSARCGKVDAVYVSFVPAEASGNWVAHAALLGFGVRSKVDGGPNLGKTLTHDFVVLEEAKNPFVRKRDVYRADLKLRLKAETAVDALGVAVWVTRGENPLPVQCTGGYIKPPQKNRKK